MTVFYATSPSTVKIKLLQASAVILLILLFFIPYREIRIERIRAFGEAKAIGTVVRKKTVSEGDSKTAGQYKSYYVSYRFIDPDGLPHQREAHVDAEFWEELTRGDSVVVHYAKAEPAVSRLDHESESAVVKLLAKFSRTNVP